MNKFLLTIAFLLTAFNSGASELDQIPFKHLETNTGLPLVRYLYRDSNDFLWVGTDREGLVRYSHNNIKAYTKQDNDSNSILSNAILGIIEDHKNNIWVSTNIGVSRINQLTGRIDNLHSK